MGCKPLGGGYGFCFDQWWRPWVDRSRDDSYIYRIEEVPSQSHVYDPKLQKNLEPLLHKLTFASGQQLTETGSKIGQALQRVRALSRYDGELLEIYAAELQPYR